MAYSTIFGIPLIILFIVFNSLDFSISTGHSALPKYPIEIPLGNFPQKATLDDKYVTKKKCQKLQFAESFVCVCNGTFCDEPVDNVQIDLALDNGKAVVFISDPEKFRLEPSEVPFEKKQQRRPKSDKSAFRIVVDASRQYQSVLGFGGAFTDAAGLNMNSLSENARLNLLKAYFDKENGIRYSLGRVPIASCDFSTRVYSYCDTPGDFQLKTFALAKEDLEMKIPNIQKAIELAGGIKLYGSPWSAPGWMKTNGKMQNGGTLRGTLSGPYYATYAQYFRRFFEEYHRVGNISFWGMTIENEPPAGLDPTYQFQSMWISPEMQREFADKLIAPAMSKSPVTKDILIMGHDDSVNTYIYESALQFFNRTSPNSTTSIAGLAYHWYADFANPNKTILSQLHELFPDHFFLGSEACTGWDGPVSDRGPSMGNWTRAQMYGRDILRGLQNWAVGWTDWNLCLDERGGPNWVNNVVDAPIIVNSKRDEFYKQPMFYGMAHFSRFILPNSVRIHSELAQGKFAPSAVLPDKEFPPVEFVAFRVPNGNRLLVILSNTNTEIDVIIEEKGRETESARISLPPRAFATVLWPKVK